VGTRCANHVTPLYPQKLALTSPTGGGRSVGMVRSRTKATEFLDIFRPPECPSSRNIPCTLSVVYIHSHRGLIVNLPFGLSLKGD